MIIFEKGRRDDDGRVPRSRRRTDRQNRVKYPSWKNDHSYFLFLSAEYRNEGYRIVGPSDRTVGAIPLSEWWTNVPGSYTDHPSYWQAAQSNTAQLWDGSYRRGWWWRPRSSGGWVSERDLKLKGWLVNNGSVSVSGLLTIFILPSDTMGRTWCWNTTMLRINW